MANFCFVQCVRAQRSCPGARSQRARAAFTLIELLVVMGLMVLLMGLVVPALIGIKGGGDVTKTAYDVAGVLESARAYAKANNTYAWVGFFEEDGSKGSTSPATAGTGRIVMSIVSSSDGTTIYNPNSALNPDPIDPTRLNQLTKLVKVDNAHLASFPDGPGGDGSTFDTRPVPGMSPYPDKFARIGVDSGGVSYPPTSSKFPFQYPVGNPKPTAQYTFTKTIQFSPRGEAIVNSTYSARPVVEIGLQPTHGSTVDTASKNLAAVQFTGLVSNVKIYRK